MNNLATIDRIEMTYHCLMYDYHIDGAISREVAIAILDLLIREMEELG